MMSEQTVILFFSNVFSNMCTQYLPVSPEKKIFASLLTIHHLSNAETGLLQE